MLDSKLQVFKTVVEQKSFSKAADLLHMTQSSVSQQIQHIEEEYGVKLFDRMYRQIAITEAGKVLYPYAVEINKLYREADKTLQGLMEDICGRLQIGASLTIGEYVLPKILVAFRTNYPKVEIEMEVANTEQIIQRVIEGNISVGFIEGVAVSSENLMMKPCGEDSLSIIASNTFKPYCKGASLNDLMKEKWVLREHSSGTRRVFEKFLLSHGYEPSKLHLVMELGSTQAIKEAVNAGVGMSVISSLAIQEELEREKLRAITLEEGKIQRKFMVVVRQDTFHTHAVDKFIAFIGDDIS